MTTFYYRVITMFVKITSLRNTIKTGCDFKVKLHIEDTFILIIRT